MLAKGGSFNCTHVEPDTWLVIKFGHDDYDYVPHYDKDGSEKDAARSHGAELVQICGAKEAAKKSVIACLEMDV